MPRFRVLAASLLAILLVGRSLLPSPCHAAVVGYWKFDACTVTDAGVNALDLTPNGTPTCVAGRFNEGWTLNGTTQYLERGYSAALTPGDRAWSISAWVRTTSADTLMSVLGWYRCGANPGCTTADGAYYALFVYHHHADFEMRDDGLNPIALEDSAHSINDGQWHFLVGTRNATRDTVRLYVDGALRKAKASGTGNVGDGGIQIPLEIGRWYRTGWSSPAFYFSGTVDEVRIHDNELTAKDVASLFAQNLVAGVRDAPPPLPLAILTSNPVRGLALAVAFDLPESGPARLELFDALGRRIVTREVGGLGTGRYQIDLSGGRVLPAGIYTIRLTQSARSGTRSVAILR